MTTRLKWDALAADGAAPSFTSLDAAVVDFDSAGVGYARFGPSGATAGTSRGAKIRSLNAGTPVDGVTVFANGTVQIGAAGGAGSRSPLEICTTSDTGLSIATNSTAAANGVECYIAAFIPADGGGQYKAGVWAVQWCDKDTTTGFASVNMHASYFSSPGVQADDIFFCGWGKQGAAFFGDDSTAAGAPGLDILKVYGDLVITDDLTVQDGVASFQVCTVLSLAASSGADSTQTLITGRNTSTGTSARFRAAFGNNGSANATTLDVYGGNHAAKPNMLELFNQFQAEFALGANGEANIRMSHSGAAHTLGFYNATPVALQTGVAVSAAGIHAALVNLGLITA